MKKKLLDLTRDQLRDELRNRGLPVGGSKSELVIRLENAFQEIGLNAEEFEFEVDATNENDDFEDEQTGGSPTKHSPAIDMTAMLQMLTDTITKSSE